MMTLSRDLIQGQTGWASCRQSENLTQCYHCQSHHSSIHEPFPRTKYKVTIHPDFFGTVPNFDRMSRENYEISKDAELSWIPNRVPILSHYECNITSHDDKVYIYTSYSPNTYRHTDAFLSSSKCTKSIFTGTVPRTCWGSLQCSPRLLVSWEG